MGVTSHCSVAAVFLVTYTGQTLLRYRLVSSLLWHHWRRLCRYIISVIIGLDTRQKYKLDNTVQKLHWFSEHTRHQKERFIPQRLNADGTWRITTADSVHTPCFKTNSTSNLNRSAKFFHCYRENWQQIFRRKTSAVIYRFVTFFGVSRFLHFGAVSYHTERLNNWQLTR